jgi:hypothetical protein
MAKLPAGILSPPSGKVGNVVGASWKGIDYIREYVIPANPQTALQIAERDKFADLVDLAKVVLGSVLQVFWDPFLRKVSGWAHFIGINRKLYAGGDDYSTIKMSEGTLEGAVIDTCVYSAPNLAISWDATCMGNGQATDKAVFVVYDEEYKVAWVSTVQPRSAEGAVIDVGAGRTATKLNCWLFFADSSTAPTKVSPSDHELASTP